LADTTVLIKISDNGIGIAPKDMPYIFDPFYRGSNSRREDGRGFGLSVVKSVADSFGWTVAVESEEGRGSVFTVTIPLS
jgi:signal transduction histidine kinase